MKILIRGLAATLLFTLSAADADVLGSADDTYLGLQVTIPLGAKSSRSFAGSNQYSLMLLEQSSGIRDGVAFTLSANGTRQISYIRPSSDYKIGHSRLSDYTVPMFIHTSGDDGVPEQRFGEFLELVAGNPIYLLLGVVYTIDLIGEVMDDVSDGNIANSEDDSQDANEIAGSTTGVSQESDQSDPVADAIDQAADELEQTVTEIEITINDQLDLGG